MAALGHNGVGGGGGDDAGADVSLLCSEVDAAGGLSIRPPSRGSQGEEEELSSRRSTVAVVQSATATARPTLDD